MPTFEKSRSAYDYNNVWIRKTVGSNTTIFIPENYQITVQIDNNTVTHHYLRTPQTQDKLLADTTPTAVLWSFTDHLGTIRDILGETSTHVIYDVFGNLTSGTNPILFAFTGKAFDTDTQLQNNINRWYDATIGRWLSIDPIEFNGNDTNLYRYVRNSILICNDISGLKVIKCQSIHPRQVDPIRYVQVSGDYDLSLCDPCKNFGNLYIAVKHDRELSRIIQYCHGNSECEKELVTLLNYVVHRDINIFGTIENTGSFIGDVPVFFGERDTCSKWCAQFVSDVLNGSNPHFRYFTYEDTQYDYNGLWPFWSFHQVVVITFRDNPDHVFMLDNGWYGGENHILFPENIPDTFMKHQF